MTFDDQKKSLRSKAESMLIKISTSGDEVLNHKEVHNLIEELSVHQIELELQNEELLATQMQLEETRHRYIRLFNDAPVGYVILDSAGIIRHFNNTFMEMVSALGEGAAGKGFADLLVAADAEVFRARYKAFYKSPDGKQISVRLSSGITGTKGLPDGYHVQLEAKHTHGENYSGQSCSREFLVTVTEINDLVSIRNKREDALKEKESVIKALQVAMSEVKKLSGLLPICSHCKKIRDDKGYWQQIEVYIDEHSDAQFSHSICRECAEIHYPDYDIYSEASE